MSKTTTKDEGSTAVDERPTTALAVVSHALTGTLDEKVRAFDQMAAAMAQIQLNGFDTVQKCKAGFWLADGVGEHPAVFIQNHWIMSIKGRLTVEPKWEYMVRKLKETVPGFTFKVLIETDDCAKVQMSDGVDTHVVEYTLHDAKRQGLLGRGENAWTSGSTREMCLKQAIKRAARRIGVGRAPLWADVEVPLLDDGRPEREPSSAMVMEGDEAPDTNPTAQVGSASPATPGRPNEAAVDSPSNDPIKELSAALVKMYGKQPTAVALAKATLLYNQMMLEETGTDPGTNFKTVAAIGPVDAQRIVDYIGKREKRDSWAKQPEKEKVAEPPEELAAGSDGDEPPPAEVEARVEEVAASDGDAYETLMRAIQRARKVFGRKFLVEAPKGSGKFWLIDQATFSQAGFEASQKVMDGGDIVMPTATMQQLTRILQKDCDDAERGRP